MNGKYVLPAIAMEVANKGRSTVLSDSEVSRTGRCSSGMELYNSYVDRARHQKLVQALICKELTTDLADENTLSTSNADRERAIGVGAVMLEVPGEVRDLAHTDDGKFAVPYATKCFIVHGADGCFTGRYFIGRGWSVGYFVGRHDEMGRI